MAARTLRPRHQDEVRAKIQASQLINVLQNHALGTDSGELAPTRLKAIEILLRKSVADLSAVELTGKDGDPIETRTTVDFADQAAALLAAMRK